MTVEKFGLEEFERYETEVGFKDSDVRTIKGVCAIVNVPITVVSEVKELIDVLSNTAEQTKGIIADNKSKDVENAKKTKENIVNLKAQREKTKKEIGESIKHFETDVNVLEKQVKRLEKLLNRFS